MMLRKQKFDPNDQHRMCSVFAMFFDKSWYLIELLTQNASGMVPGGIRLVYRKGSLIPDENFSQRVLVNQVTWTLNKVYLTSLFLHIAILVSWMHKLVLWKNPHEKWE